MGIIVSIRLVASLVALLIAVCFVATTRAAKSRPNILIAISDDQSWPHASAYGSTMVKTPNFDRIAREGVLFSQAFCASPGCSPSRAALLTGRNTWQLEHAGTHASFFHPKFKTFPDRLAEEGYFVGHVGKGWGPGDFKHLGRTTNPAGPAFAVKGDGAHTRSSYAAGFQAFLAQRPAGKPFCFWFGSRDPHRGFKPESGLGSGKKLEDAELPPFLPDTPEIRSDLLDYAFEVERFDTHLGELLRLLEETGEFDKTLILVTSDNGMPFPRAKANCYEFGIHVPLAMRLHQGTPDRVVDDLVGFTDLTATIYDLSGVTPVGNRAIEGRSLRGILESDRNGIVDKARAAVYSARERHSSSRYHSLGYPQRCIRTLEYLYIRNYRPERWPAGPSQKYARVRYSDDGDVLQATLERDHGGYHDIDAGPTLSFLIARRGTPHIGRFLDLAVARRPAEELFDIQADPGCLTNLATDPAFRSVKEQLASQLNKYLATTGDSRVSSNGDVWETYPRVSKLRWFPRPDWAKESRESVPRQDWLERRRPR